MKNLKIELLEEIDLPAVTEIGPKDWGGITSIHQFYLTTNFCHCIKVVSGNTIVGIGTAMVFEGSAWLAHIIVGDSSRRQGIGGLIVEYLLDYTTNMRGCRTVSLNATDMGYPLYLKYGFRPDSEYRIMTASLKISFSGTDDSAEQIRKIQPGDWEQILNIDKHISAECREGMIRPFLSSGFVYDNEGVIQGFYLPDSGNGPVQAIEEKAGIALLKFRLQKHNSAVVPVDNGPANIFLKDSGYTGNITISRMVFGSACNWKPLNTFNRTGGYIG